MQPTDKQAQLSLDALLAEPTFSSDPEVHVCTCADEFPAGLVRWLCDAPAVRPDRLAAARRRLAAGDRPTDEALARRMVARLVCDRLR